MAEIDRARCGDCRFFKYTGIDKWGYTPNETGDGICTNDALSQVSIVNRSLTPRIALGIHGQTEEIQRMEGEKSTCFVFGGLEFDNEALEAFIPTPEEKRQWMLEDICSDPNS